MSAASEDATTYVVSGSSATAKAWTPRFEGSASQTAVSTQPVFTAGLTSSGVPFVVAALVTDVAGGALEADRTRLEIATLDTSTGQPLGPSVTLPWQPDQEVPDLPTCAGERLALQISEDSSNLSQGDPVAVVLDLASGKQVFRAPLAVAPETSLAVSGNRVLATLASAYADVQRTGSAPVASSTIGGGSSEVVIGGNAFDYAYFGADQTWIPGLVGGEKQPAPTISQPYESYTFPAPDPGSGSGSVQKPFVASLPTTGPVVDFYDPATTTKLMVATDLNGDASAVAALDYETGRAIPLGWFPKNPGALDLRIYGFYDGNLWVTSKGRPLVFTMQGDEVPRAAGWATFPLYVGEGWAVLSSDDNEVAGVVLGGDFDPELTTTSLEELSGG